MMKKSHARADIGVIGGSGLYEMEGLRDIRELAVQTPFGKPSNPLLLGTILTERMPEGVRVAFLSRHGRGHRFSPSEINYRANIYALKSVGVGRVLSVSAVGSMKEHIRPGDVVLPHQFIDLTKRRSTTFFEEGIVAHVAFSDPVCPRLTAALQKATQEANANVHTQGTYLCIEGPQFSTRAESLLYRQWGVDVIGMTNLPEAKLAREAELCYATMALVTDYDSWREHEAAVTVKAILETLRKNIVLAKRVLRSALSVAAEPRTCACGQALEHAVITAAAMIPSATRKRLSLLMGKYLPKKGRVVRG
jgi:5'-methylthioadenosine phosphorylase